MHMKKTLIHIYVFQIVSINFDKHCHIYRKLFSHRSVHSLAVTLVGNGIREPRSISK